ncbi:hypothetical protein OSB04_007752 [Centaurea solstitialis]|uniref:Rab3GAP catalytic subunit conserved domain-containing protein n=1 Tax=Centaurea solstitialis TaxID=347529 RepID=A0AA38WIV2_9ASTR|nr:hypothetical protein OSB04_007752 [Centaurea solstitialis]
MFQEKECNSPVKDDISRDIVPSVNVLKQLAIGVQTTKIVKSMKDLMILSREESPVKERSPLRLSAMKSFVVGEKEDTFSYEFGRDAKVMSFIHSLINTEGHFSRRKIGSRVEKNTNTNLTNFAKEIHGAPPECFVTDLAEAMGSLKTLRKMGLFWATVVAEVRSLWCEGQHIPGIPPDENPDLNSCLLYQQFQVINCCISRKRRRAIATESLESVLKLANLGGDHKCRDVPPLSPVVYARISSGELVLRLGADKRRENCTLLKTGEPVYTPVMQEGPLLTEDFIKETEELVLRTGSVGVGCSQLLSDMQAFKAANPGCILEDFVRWHSPPDWTEASTADESKESTTDGNNLSSKGQLSIRMQKEGMHYVICGENCGKLQNQYLLLDNLHYTMRIYLCKEGILHSLENISPSGLFEQLFLSLLSSGCTIAEGRIYNNENMYKTFKECKDYIILTCQAKNWIQKADDICQVYETVRMMALHPDGVIRVTTKQGHDDSESFEQKGGGFGKLGSMFGGGMDSKTPPKNQEPTTFTKKAPKPKTPFENIEPTPQWLM